MVMASTQRTVSLAELRAIARWTAACAARALSVFEAAAPRDRRPRIALDGARAFARGGPRTAKLRTDALASLAAAREVDDPAASAAARAAGTAGSSAFTHATISAHQINHILGPAVNAARARELAAGEDPKVGDNEIALAVRRATPALRAVVRRMPRRHGKGKRRLEQLYVRLEDGLRGKTRG
jgi:hypothetical protein